MSQTLNENILQFIPYYPSIEDKNFTKAIASKKEFYDYRLEENISVPLEPGVPLPHQVLSMRYFSRNTPYNKGLIFQGMGVGKCVTKHTKILVDGEYVESWMLWEKFKSKIFSDGEKGEWSKPIKKLNVVSYDFISKKYVTSQVENLYRQLIFSPVKILQFEDVELGLTFAHKLYCVDNSMWTNDFVRGKRYASFSSLYDDSTWRTLLNIKEETYMGYVYDFEVGEYHNYVAETILCHNTCLASLVIENMKEYDKGPALIFVKNEDMIKNYQDEIINTCTKDKYIFRYNEREKSKLEKIDQNKNKLTERKKEITDKLLVLKTPPITDKTRKDINKLESEKIKVEKELSRISLDNLDINEEKRRKRIIKSLNASYEFHTYDFFKKLPANEAIRKLYSNRKIIVDEAHWLRKQKGKEQETEPYYDAAHRFLHNVDNCIILLMTGTPIWDNVSEIAALMNLILDEDEQLPTGKKFVDKFFDKDKKLINEEELVNVFRGKISYLRSNLSDIIKIDQGITQPWLDIIKVFPTAMSDFQYEYYKNAEKEESVSNITFRTKKGEELVRKIVTKGGTIYKLAKDASNFVYPIYDKEGNIIGGGYGKKYFEDYCVKKTKKFKRNAQGESIPYIETTYEITNPFFKRDIKNKLYMFSSKFSFVIDHIKQHPGEVTFTYTGESVTRAGAILLGLCMKEHGFMPCKTADQAAVKHPNKFVVITSNPNTISTSTEINKVLKIVGSKNNVTGDYVAHIIGSEKIALGLSIKNAKRVYDLSSHWNTSHKEQAIFRILRLGSQKWLTDKTVEIYRVVATKKGALNKGAGYPRDAGFSDESTIDIYTYQTSEHKDKYNSQIYRLMKKLSWDCPLNYRANVSANDINGSRECDFQDCNYACYGFKPTSTDKKVWTYEIPTKDIDISTFNDFSAEYKIHFKNIVYNIFRKRFAITYTELMKLANINETLVITLLLAVDEIIQQKIPMKNRYGVRSYLKEKNNILFLHSDICEPKFYFEFLYCSNFLTTDITSMRSQLTEEFFKKDLTYIKELCKCADINCVKNILDKCHYKTIIIIIEGSVAAAQCNKICKFIKNIYQKDLHKDKDGHIFHILHYTEYTGVGYDVLNKKIEPKGLTRLFKNKWEYVSDLTLEKELIASIKKTKHVDVPKTDFGITGIIDKTSKFKIHIHTEGEGKKKTRGRVCNSYSKEEILGIYATIGYLPKPSAEVQDLSNKDLKIKMRNLPEYSAFFENYDLDNEDVLRRVISLASTGIPELCKKLENWFIKNNYVERL